MESRQKLSYKTGRPFETALALAITRAWPVCPLHLYYHLYHRRYQGLAPHDSLHPRFSWGHGIFNSIFVNSFRFYAGFDDFRAIV